MPVTRFQAPFSRCRSRSGRRPGRAPSPPALPIPGYAGFHYDTRHLFPVLLNVLLRVLRRVLYFTALKVWQMVEIDTSRSSCISQSRFKEVMRALLYYSLIESYEHIESYSIHPVVHDWCTESISRGQVDNILLAFTIVGSAVPSQSEPEHWLTQQRLIPHADRCIRCLQKVETLDGVGYSGSHDSFP